MAVSPVCRVLCILGTTLVMLPHVNLGLLSDYKICGDSACESMISSAQAIRDHHGKDCRFLSFKRGDVIFVYHKLTGKRDDLWAGGIDRQFGYFPKDAVQEEQVFAATEKVVETRKSDFFCVDEYGYPTDSSHLDSDDDDDAEGETEKEIPSHESESTQASTHTESSLKPAGEDSTESTVSAQEAEENEEKNNVDATEDTQNTAAPNEQGGSPPSSGWLGSSVTGWLGLGKEERPDHVAEEQKEDENKDTQTEASLASSVTSWLTRGREGTPEYATDSVETGKETADSVTASVSGWLGFGKEEKADSPNEEEEEPVETFRSRRMSLDLEGSQLHEEEEKDTGTFGWLKDGLTSKLGFELNKGESESGHDASAEETDKDEKEPPSGSWLDIGGILGLKKDNNGDESGHPGNSLEERENDEDTAILQNASSTQSQPALTDDVKIETSILEEPPKDQNAHSTESAESSYEEIKNDEDTAKLENVIDTQSQPASTEDEKIETSILEEPPKDQNAHSTESAESRFEEIKNDEDTARLENVIDTQSQPASTEGEKIETSILEEPPKDQNAHSTAQNKDTDFKEDESREKEQNKIDDETSAEAKDEDHEQNNEAMEQIQEAQIPISNNQDSTTQTDINLSPDHTFMSSTGEGKVDDAKDPIPFETGGDYHVEARSGEEAEVSHKEILSTQTEELADESLISSEQSNDPIPAENSVFTSHGEAPNQGNTETEAVIDTNIETETSYSEVPQEKETQSTEGGSQEFTSLHFTSSDTESLKENPSQDEKGQISFDGSTSSAESVIEVGKDTSEGGRQELMEEKNRNPEDTIQVEEIKTEVNQEEVEQLVDVVSSDKPNESIEVEEIKEVEIQGEVQEIVDEQGNVKQEDSLMVEEIVKENPQEMIVSNSEEENEKLEDLKVLEETKEEKQQDMKQLEEIEIQHEIGDVKEERGLEEIMEKENKEEDGKIQEQINVFDSNEENKAESAAELPHEDENAKIPESKGEEIEHVMEVAKEQETVGEGQLKEMAGLQELVKEETGEKQVQTSQFEVQLENSPDDSSTIKSGGNEEINQDESFTSSFVESSTKTESPQTEEKCPAEDEGQVEVAEVKDDKMEQAEEKHVEDDNLKCSHGLCTEGGAEGLIVEGESSTVLTGMSAVDEKIEEQINHTMDLIHSDGEIISEAEQTQELGTMEGKVEDEIKENVNQEEVEKLGDDKSIHKPEYLREEEEKQDKVEESVDEQGNAKLEDSVMVEETMQEKPEEVKVFQGEKQNENVEDVKVLEEIKEEKQQEIETFEESEKHHESDDAKEESVSEEIGEKEYPEEENNLKERNFEEQNKVSNQNEENDSWSIEKQEISASTSDLEQSPSLGSPLPDNDDSRNAAESETKGTFGFFKNALGYFSKAPTTETEDSTEQAQTPNLNENDTLQPQLQSSLTPNQDLDSAVESSQNQEESSESSTEPPQSSTDPHNPSPNPEALLQTKALSKHYKNLLVHVDIEEMTILLDLFGQHKLQFLDYILSSSELENPDGDQSIVSDIERLLEHHREKMETSSMNTAEGPQEDIENTRTLTALQKLDMMLASVRNSFHAGLSDVSVHKAEDSCVDTSCFSEVEIGQTQDSSGIMENIMQGGLGLRQVLDSFREWAEDSITYSYGVGEHIIQVVSALPDDLRPGPDLYGLPWEPVIFTTLVGLVTVLLFTCRCYSSVKSRMYRSRERRMAQQVAQLLDEKCEVLETLSQHQQEYDDLETSLKDSGVLAQSEQTEQLEARAKHLAHAKTELESDLTVLRDQLDQQREHRTEQEKQIAALEKNMKTIEEEMKDLQSQDEQAQTTVKVYSMNSDRLERNLDTAGEENTLLQESNAQLKQQVEGWAERMSEMEAAMRRCEVAHSGMLHDVTTKDERIKSLTDRLLSIKAWDSDLEEDETDSSYGTAGKEDANGSGDGTETQGHLQKVQKLIYAAKLNADLKSVDEDKDRMFAKLNDEVKAKEDLQVAMKDLENEKLSLQSDTEHYSEQVQRLQQKLQIMTEMYQENELKLHRLLTVEEKERLQKEEKLNKADKNIAMAMEELNNYRQRAGEMEDELEKTKQSYQTQISAHEKKAHNNWLAARAADRELSDIRRENALLRQKLTDTQFKLDALDKDPYALDSLARPLPFRGERSPYGPSPLGRPASETRPFLSPPPLMEGPPPRLSPRVPRGPGEPPGAQGEMERSGGPHSDSGSISPTWDRRGPPPGPPGPLGPPGYMFPDPGGPMYRRPPPHPAAMGLLPPPGPLHPRGFPPGPPHPVDLPDGAYREHSIGGAEQEHRESGPGERKTPPESDPRMGGPPPPGPPMGPMDGPFPRRPLYGPPPPADFYPPRGPGGPPIMPSWAPPPPGMMLPPGFPPRSHVPPYSGPMRHPPPSDGLPPHLMGPPPPRQSVPPPQDNPVSPEDAI